MHVDVLGAGDFKIAPLPVIKIAPDVIVSFEITEWQVLPIDSVHISLFFSLVQGRKCGKIRNFIHVPNECKKKSSVCSKKKYFYQIKHKIMEKKEEGKKGKTHEIKNVVFIIIALIIAIILSLWFTL